MSDFIPKPGAVKIGGLSRKAQKLQALRDKAEQNKTGAKPATQGQAANAKAKDFNSGRKTSFQRKAV